MTPFWQDDHLTLYGGDCRAVLAEMPAESVHCVVTSPPYWGLRDYGTATWDGGDQECDHRVSESDLKKRRDVGRAQTGTFNGSAKPSGDLDAPRYVKECGKCGARRIDSQLGLEPTPEEYVANMVAVFREVKRVLRRDGTLWLNIGDSYASGPVGVQRVRSDRRQEGSSEGDVQELLPPGGAPEMDGRAPGAVSGDLTGMASGALERAERADVGSSARAAGEGDDGAGRDVRVLLGEGADLPDAGSRPERRLQRSTAGAPPAVEARGGRGLPEGSLPDPLLELQRGEGAWRMPSRLDQKQLVGTPWRLAFALQADGWYLRSDIIWAKPNPMPESVTDRPTKAHEYLFLLSKSPRYYYDAEAVREANDPANMAHHDRYSGNGIAGKGRNPNRGDGGGTTQGGVGYNPAGRNLRSVWTIATEPYPGAHFATFPRKLVEPCVKAGTSERGVCAECGAPWVREVDKVYRSPIITTGTEDGRYTAGRNRNVTRMGDGVDVTTTGWSPSCRHDAEPVPAVVLDPFAGSGTTLLVAQSLGRRGVGIDLSSDYLKQALARNAQTPLGLVG